MKTIKQLAQEALNVQDACNLSAVAIAFGKVMEDMCKHIPNTTDRNKHPIVTLWIDKLAHLGNYTQDYGPKVQQAYKICMSWANGPAVELSRAGE